MASNMYTADRSPEPEFKVRVSSMHLKHPSEVTAQTETVVEIVIWNTSLK